jgi:low affinity Fe/Cu permease
MQRNGASRMSKVLESFALWVTRWTGSSWSFTIALGLMVLWLVTGPIYHYSDTWQLVMNTVSSIVTFLMVFLLQRSQNKDTMAMQVKLNELIAAQRGADNSLINLEELSEDEVRALHDRYQRLVKVATETGNHRESLVTEEQTLGPDMSANLPPSKSLLSS